MAYSPERAPARAARLAYSGRTLEPARKPATYEDLCALPEHLIGELIGGTLYGQPRPAGPHALVLSGLGIDLGGPFDRGRGGVDAARRMG